MQKLEPIELLDEVLNFIKIGEHWKTLKVIRSHFRALNIELTPDDLTRILLKLMDDDYVLYSKVEDYTKDHYKATYDGMLFSGYIKQREIDEINFLRAGQLEKRIEANEKSLRRATWFAGFAATAVLLWYIFIYFYPVHKDYPYWIWQTIPKKSP
jgi:hypothetical protein